MLNRKSRTTRLSSLDMLRGLAVLLMVEAHITIMIPFISELAGVLAAPTFLFVAGLSFQLFLQNRESRALKSLDVFLEVFWRAVALFFITSLITWTANLVLGWESSVFTNIFVIISTGFLVGYLVRRSFKGKVLAIILVLVLDLLIRGYNVEGLAFLAGYGPGLQVSVLPYLCYFFFGQLAYTAYKKENFNCYDNQILLVYALLFFLLNLAVYLTFPYPLVSELRGYLPMLFMVASLLILLLLVLVRVVELDGKLKRWLRPLENLGHVSFTSYYISYASFILLGTLQFSQPVPANLLIFLATSGGLVLLEKHWRPSYRYGLEWWYRRVSAWGLSHTQKYLG
ncbi:MAG: heparan-alpha-glucosaminide N-acetyltransferase domain-containing protein [Euryarchaeota archaeon]|nr:heparan-alpha-glucosaminide N-acetyltransferase domain-containing protein [Euryarchaeota archaeon]